MNITRRKLSSAVAVTFLAASVAACGGGGSDDQASSTTNLQAVSGGGSADFISLPILGAFELLEEEEGITVELRYVDDGATAIQAMQQGEAVIGGNIGVNTGVPAVDAGADIVDIMATQRPTWALAAVSEINDVADLDGKRIAVHGEASFTRAIAQYYGDEEGIEYTELIIPGSEVRAEAMANGTVDASVLDLPDVVQLAKTYPGAFKTLTTIGEDFPDLIEQDMWVSREWAEANPEVATKLVEAVLTTNQRLTDDLDYAFELASRHLPDVDEDVLRDLVAEYSERGIWATDGLLTADRALTTLEFFSEIGELQGPVPTEETLDTYFDFSYLESALDNLGSS